jgi:hypothetical protein
MAASSGAWASGLSYNRYDFFLDGTQSAAVAPTAPNGLTYVATKNGTSHASTQPTWVNSYLPNGAVPYAWTVSMKRKIGDYGAPSSRNGHYYRVTAVSDPDANGFGSAGATEPGVGMNPNWPTTGGGTVTDGDLTWTEQGSDVGTYVADGSTEWQCVGPKPVSVAAGAMEGVATAELTGDSGRNLTIAEQAHGTIKVTGTLTGTRNIFFLTLPATDSLAYTRCIRNATSGGQSIIAAIAGAGGTVTIGNGKTAIVGVDTGGVYRKTPDV